MCLNAFATWQGLNIAVESNQANQICDNIKPYPGTRNVGYLLRRKIIVRNLAYQVINFLGRFYLNQKLYTWIHYAPISVNSSTQSWVAFVGHCEMGNPK